MSVVDLDQARRRLHLVTDLGGIEIAITAEQLAAAMRGAP